MRNFHILFAVLLLSFLGSCQSNPYKIIPVKPFFSIENSSAGKDKYQYFSISNFANNINVSPDSFKTFALKNLDPDYFDYDNYVVQFYDRNATFVKDYETHRQSDIKLYGDYVVFNFFWKKGIFFGYQHLKNGILIKSKFQ